MHGRLAPAALIGFLALAATEAVADQLVVGKRLLLRNPSGGANQLVHRAGDATLIVGNASGAADPRCSASGGGGASSVRIVAAGGAGDVVIPLPCGGWTSNGSNTVYRYRDATGATCKLVLVKHHALLKAVCKGAQVGIDLDAGMAPVALVTTLNTERYCTEFGGAVVRDGSDQQSFLARNAPAPTACPATVTTTTTAASTTSTTLAYCCALPGRCVFSSPSQPSELCEQAGGTVHPEYGCDGGTGSCASGSGVAGPCCERTYVVPHQVSCESGPSVTGPSCTSGGNWVAAFYPSAVCTESGSCEP
jgi:hypothetical protein